MRPCWPSSTGSPSTTFANPRRTETTETTETTDWVSYVAKIETATLTASGARPDESPLALSRDKRAPSTA